MTFSYTGGFAQEGGYMRLHAFRFAVAAGIVGAIGYALATLAALVHIPGFEPFARVLEGWYGPYGYSLSGLGIVIGAMFGFIEGFVWLGALAWLYNRLVARR